MNTGHSIWLLLILAICGLLLLRPNEQAMRVEPLDSPSWPPAADAFSAASQLWPPDAFKGDVASLVIFAGASGIHKICGVPPEGFVRLGCQGTTADGVSIIAVANPCLFPEDDFFAGIMCHEIAHSNGWTHE